MYPAALYYKLINKTEQNVASSWEDASKDWCKTNQINQPTVAEP